MKTAPLKPAILAALIATLTLLSFTAAQEKSLPPTVRALEPSPFAAPGVTFTDVTKAAGLGGFRHVSGSPGRDYIIEATGSGCAFIDYDNDGWINVYLVNGSSTSGQLIVVTKSGGSQYHGAAFEYHRNRVLNARPWNASERPFNIQNNFGANFGGPIKLPGKIFGPLGYEGKGKHRSFFYFNWEAFRAAGGASVPTYTIPSAKARLGDFTDWKDSSGKLIPVCDPTTTRPNPAFNPALEASATNQPFLRDQVSCNGVLNVICPNRINAIAAAYLKFMPAPNRPGELNNHLLPRAVPNTLINGSNVYMFRIDHNYGESDHFYFTFWRQFASINTASALPREIATESPTTPLEKL